MRPAWLLLLVVACGPRPIPPPPKPVTPDIPKCPVYVNLRPELSCDGWFTSEGYNCVLCEEAEADGCFVQDVQVYCVKNYACSKDPRCSEER